MLQVPGNFKNEFPSNYAKNLPAGWDEEVSPDGRVFYVDHVTKKTQWHHPLTGKRKRVVSDLPPGWKRMEGPDGRKTFVNEKKNITTAVDPRLPYVLEEKEYGQDMKNESLMPYQFTCISYRLPVANSYSDLPAASNRLCQSAALSVGNSVYPAGPHQLPVNPFMTNNLPMLGESAGPAFNNVRKFDSNERVRGCTGESSRLDQFSGTRSNKPDRNLRCPYPGPSSDSGLNFSGNMRYSSLNKDYSEMPSDTRRFGQTLEERDHTSRQCFMATAPEAHLSTKLTPRGGDFPPYRDTSPGLNGYNKFDSQFRERDCSPERHSRNVDRERYCPPDQYIHGHVSHLHGKLNQNSREEKVRTGQCFSNSSEISGNIHNRREISPVRRSPFQHNENTWGNISSERCLSPMLPRGDWRGHHESVHRPSRFDPISRDRDISPVRLHDSSSRNYSDFLGKQKFFGNNELALAQRDYSRERFEPEYKRRCNAYSQQREISPYRAESKSYNRVPSEEEYPRERTAGRHSREMYEPRHFNRFGSHDDVRDSSDRLLENYVGHSNKKSRYDSPIRRRPSPFRFSPSSTRIEGGTFENYPGGSQYRPNSSTSSFMNKKDSFTSNSPFGIKEWFDQKKGGFSRPTPPSGGLPDLKCESMFHHKSGSIPGTGSSLTEYPNQQHFRMEGENSYATSNLNDDTDGENSDGIDMDFTHTESDDGDDLEKDDQVSAHPDPALAQPSQPPIRGRRAKKRNQLRQQNFLTAVIAEGYPRYDSLTREQANEVTNLIIDGIERLDPISDIHPRFSGHIYKVGAVLVSCLDRDSLNWVREIVGNLVLSSGTKLKACSPKCLRGTAIVGGFFPPMLEGEEKFLNKLSLENPFIDMSLWSVLRQDQTKKGLCISIGTPKDSIAVLEEHKRILLFNGRPTKITVLSRKNSGKRPARAAIRKMAEDAAPRRY